MKIAGKPLLSIYHLGNFKRMFGGNDGARQAIQTLRDEVAKAGFPGLVLLMELRNTDRNTIKAMSNQPICRRDGSLCCIRGIDELLRGRENSLHSFPSPESRNFNERMRNFTG